MVPVYSIFYVARNVSSLTKPFISILLLIFLFCDSSANNNQMINCPPVAVKSGLILSKTTPSLQLRGCQIKGIVPLSPAWFSQLRAGNWITAVNNSKLTKQNQACQILEKEIHQAIKNKYLIQLEVNSSSSTTNTKIPIILTTRLMENKVSSNLDAFLMPSSSLVENPQTLAQLQTKLQQLYLKENQLDSLKPEPFTTLACLTNSAPVTVLPLIKQIQQQPMKLKGIMESIQQQLSQSEVTEFSLAAFIHTVQSLSYTNAPVRGQSQMTELPDLINSKQDTPFTSTSNFIVNRLSLFLKSSHLLSTEAFKKISHQERQFFLHNYSQLSSSIEKSQTLSNETDRQNLEVIVQLFKIAEKVNYKKLSTAAWYWFQLAEKNWLKQLSNPQHTLFSNQRKVFTTPYGTIVLGSYNDDTYVVNNYRQAIIIDPGGNDRYLLETQKELSDNGPLMNTAIIDLAGNDSYNSTQNKGFASAILGISLLIDLQGDDNYQAKSWAQGSAFAGVAALYDLAGDDKYSAHSFSQASALFGSGILVDKKGNDSYHIKHHGQGLGLPYGHGVLMDISGSDHYLSKNGLISSYRSSDPGVNKKTPVSTESWSQGCGKGFRHILPGGIGILLDAQGDDVFSAHEFAQGSGYYYAMGLLYNLGNGNDHYHGTRYNTAASAHQAIGGLFDAAGNDYYTTSGPAFCSAAWDQSISLFHDQAGDDHYISQDFSLAAAAHNSIASFWDISGNDQFASPANPAHIVSNNYHGGKSQSYFFSASNKIMSRINQHKQEFVITCKQHDSNFTTQLTNLQKDAILCH